LLYSPIKAEKEKQKKFLSRLLKKPKKLKNIMTILQLEFLYKIKEGQVQQQQRLEMERNERLDELFDEFVYDLNLGPTIIVDDNYLKRNLLN